MMVSDSRALACYRVTQHIVEDLPDILLMLATSQPNNLRPAVLDFHGIGPDRANTLRHRRR